MSEANAYDSITAGPAFAKASAGSMNRPELIIAPVPTQKTSSRPSCFFSFGSCSINQAPSGINYIVAEIGKQDKIQLFCVLSSGYFLGQGRFGVLALPSSSVVTSLPFCCVQTLS